MPIEETTITLFTSLISMITELLERVLFQLGWGGDMETTDGSLGFHSNAQMGFSVG